MADVPFLTALVGTLEDEQSPTLATALRDASDTYSQSEVDTALAAKANTSALADYAPLASPDLTGTPTAPTADPGTNTTQIATTAFVKAAVDAAGGDGTVTSVAATVPTGLAIAGSPVTTSGTLAFTWDTGYQGYTTAEANKLAFISVTGAIDLDNVLVEDDVGTTVQGYDADTAKTDAPQEWTAGQRGTPVAIDIGANTSGEADWTLAAGNVHTITADENFTLNLPSDVATHVGQSGVIIVTQDGTGGRTMAVESGIEPYNSDTLFTIADGAGEITVIAYLVVNSTTMVISAGGVGVAL